MAMIDPATFVVTEPGEYYDRGTVQITLRGQTRTVEASRSTGRGTLAAHVTAYGIAVKYPTGTKVWPGRVEHVLDTGRESIEGGFDNRATRSRIASIVGFYADVAEQYRSGRSGTR